MTKVKISELKPLPDPVPQTRVFADPLYPNTEFAITLRALHPFSFYSVNERADKWFAEKTGKQGEFAPVEHVPNLRYSLQLLRLISLLREAEVLEEGEKPYTPSEWLGLASRCPEVFSSMALFQQELQDAYETLSKEPRNKGTSADETTEPKKETPDEPTHPTEPDASDGATRPTDTGE